MNKLHRNRLLYNLHGLALVAYLCRFLALLIFMKFLVAKAFFPLPNIRYEVLCMLAGDRLEESLSAVIFL